MMKTTLLAVLLSATLAWGYPNFIPENFPYNTGENREMDTMNDDNMKDFVGEMSYELATANLYSHSDVEVIAQSICTSLNGASPGWTYAVERKCFHGNKETCAQICTSPALRSQDPQTQAKKWIPVAALHVYKNRPSSSPGTVANPHIGLKVFQYSTIHSTGCGPNYCCCYVPP